MDLFFVLSGFLLTLPFAATSIGAGPRPDLRRYFRRRILRVFPAYYAQLFIILLAGSWFVIWRELNLTELIAHLLMFFNGFAVVQRFLVGRLARLPAGVC